MTPKDLIASCEAAMQPPGIMGLVLTIPKGCMPPGFPRGELLNEMERSGVVERTYNFKPEKVLAWCARNAVHALEAEQKEKP